MRKINSLASTKNVSDLERADVNWLIKNGEGASYNISGALIISGLIDHSAFFKSLKKLILKHDALRTKYIISSGDMGLSRVVYSDLDYIPVTYNDSLNLEGENITLEANEIANYRFTFDSFPYWRVHIGSDVEKKKTLLCLSMIHAISDGLSRDLLLADLNSLYLLEVSGRSSNTVSSKYSLENYVASQKEWIDSGAVDRALSWLDSRYGELLNNLEIAPDLYQNTDRSLLKSRVHEVKIDDEWHERAVFLTNHYGVSINALYILLGSLAVASVLGVKRFASPVAFTNRHVFGSEAIIGKISSQLPLFFNLNECKSFSELLKEVSNDWMNTIRNLGSIPSGYFKRTICSHNKHESGQTPLTMSLINILPDHSAEKEMFGFLSSRVEPKKEKFLPVNSMQIEFFVSEEGARCVIRYPEKREGIFCKHMPKLDDFFKTLLYTPETDVLNSIDEIWSSDIS